MNETEVTNEDILEATNSVGSGFSLSDMPYLLLVSAATPFLTLGTYGLMHRDRLSLALSDVVGPDVAGVISASFAGVGVFNVAMLALLSSMALSGVAAGAMQYEPQKLAMGVTAAVLLGGSVAVGAYFFPALHPLVSGTVVLYTVLGASIIVLFTGVMVYTMFMSG